MVVIKGLNKTSMVDYSPYISSTIFLSGCNFRCPFCHNPDLVDGFHLIDDIPEKEILGYLSSKQGWIDAAVITGGEPTLQKDLPLFIKKIKDIGLKVKLDTNGTNPEMISSLLEKDLVDKISMDIKSSKEKYDLACSCKVDLSIIQKSIDLLKNSSIDYEFRTTVVPGIVEKEDLIKIGSWLSKSKHFAIQQYRNTHKTLDPQYKEIKPYPISFLDSIKDKIKHCFEKIEVKES